MKLSVSALLLFLSLANAQDDPKVVGNCVSGKIGFNPNRLLNNQANASVIDPEKYEMTIDYAAQNVLIDSQGVKLILNKNENQPAQGTRMSTTRYMLYGKITVEMSAIPVPGVVVAFITMSQRGDEIDWEFTGQNFNQVHSNVFYKRIPEYAIHDQLLPVSGEGIGGSHIYTLDWKRDSLTWIVDGKPMRTLFRENSTSPMTPPGERWFPSTPSQIQISVWDGGSSQSEGTVKWAGGKINWGNATSFYASFRSIDIQCYDDNDRLVSSWPPQSSNASISFAAGNETVVGSNINTVDRYGKVRSRNSASGVTASYMALLTILLICF